MKSHKELIIEYLLEGNSPEDLAERLYELLPQEQKNKILNHIDNTDLEGEH